MNRLIDDIRNSRSVYVTPSGEIEDENEAAQNEERERERDGEARPRTKLKPEIFGAGSREVRIGVDVLDAMRAEAATCNGETGGILVGPARGVVTRLIPSGPAARRTFASYELDVAHLQPLLAAAEEEALRFLGVWHVHPKGVETLSSTDLRAAKRMLGDPDWGVDEVLLPLSVRTKRGLDTRMFRVRRGSDVVEVPALVVSTRIAPTRAASLATGRRPEIETARGVANARIERDVEALRAAGWDVNRSDVRDGVALLLTKKDLHFVVALPPEYPLSPPDVIVPEGGLLAAEPGPYIVSHAELAETDRWSSLRDLALVATQAEAVIDRLQREDTRLRRKVSRRLSRWLLRFLNPNHKGVSHDRLPFAAPFAL
jgi:proteasome lid subunit RPN8/RPN11